MDVLISVPLVADSDDGVTLQIFRRRTVSHVVIVGATAGTGRALAEDLIRDGFKVTITGRDERRSAMVAEELKLWPSATEGSIRSLAVDLSDPESLSTLSKRSKLLIISCCAA
jgi:short-subunit dehydrogenase